MNCRPSCATYVQLILFSVGLLALAGCEQFDVYQENERALMAMQRGDIDRAIGILNAAMAREPASVALWRNLSVAYRLKGDVPAATSALGKALDLAPENGQLRRELARLYLSQGQWDAVWQLFDNANIVRESTEDYLLPALAAQRQGRAESACTILANGLRAFPDTYPLLAAYASALCDAGKLDDALATARRAMERQPTAAGAAILLAQIYHLRRDANGVQEMLSALERMPTRDPLERIQLGQLLLELERFASAENEFRWAVDADPHSPEARLGLAIALYQQGKYAEGLALCEALAREQPTAAGPQTLSGYIYLSRRQRLKAIEALSASLANNPDQPAVQAVLDQLRASPSVPSTTKSGEQP